MGGGGVGGGSNRRIPGKRRRERTTALLHYKAATPHNKHCSINEGDTYSELSNRNSSAGWSKASNGPIASALHGVHSVAGCAGSNQRGAPLIVSRPLGRKFRPHLAALPCRRPCRPPTTSSTLGTTRRSAEAAEQHAAHAHCSTRQREPQGTAGLRRGDGSPSNSLGAN